MLLDVLHVLPPRATAVVFTAAAALLGALVGAVATHHHHWRRRGKAREAADAVRASSILPSPIALIGDTPMVALPRLSAALRCHIFAKCEFLNPGGSPKDRVARAIIEDAERAGLIRPHAGYTIYEGTVGSTGIALAWVCRARGYRCYIVMPDDQAREKYELLERLGAVVERVRPASIVDRQQFCNVARARALEDPCGFFANQFETMSNFCAHYTTTAPEIYRQTGGALDVLVLGAGTGGTLAGCARYLKARLPKLRVVLADPQGSGLTNKVQHNVMYAISESEGKRRRHQVDTIVEGVGSNRMTTNLDLVLGRARNVIPTREAVRLLQQQSPSVTNNQEPTSIASTSWVDSAERVTDREAVFMARYMVRHEGLFLGSSSCVNLVAAVKMARKLSSNVDKDYDDETTWPRIVTMLCDAGTRHLTKFWSDEYIVKHGVFSSEELASLSLDNLDFIK